MQMIFFNDLCGNCTVTDPEICFSLLYCLQYFRIGAVFQIITLQITEFARNRSLEYVFHQNEVFYITFILGIIIVLCITAGYWEVDRRQEKYIRTLLEYQEKLQQSLIRSGSSRFFLMISTIPMIPLIGVRISWDIWERNSLLA